eukprot:356114-Chlamydomonas_euryale.AAC.3
MTKRPTCTTELNRKHQSSPSVVTHVCGTLPISLPVHTSCCLPLPMRTSLGLIYVTHASVIGFHVVGTRHAMGSILTVLKNLVMLLARRTRSYAEFIESWVGSHIYHAALLAKLASQSRDTGSNRSMIIISSSRVSGGANRTVVDKPLLLEEFGKKLQVGVGQESPSNAAIAALRDPVYTQTYAVSESFMEPVTAGTQRPAPNATAQGYATPSGPLVEAGRPGNQSTFAVASRLCANASTLGSLSRPSCILKQAAQEASQRMAMAGTMFWNWDSPVPGFVPVSIPAADEYGVLPNQSTSQVISLHAAAVRGAVARRESKAGCVAR